MREISRELLHSARIELELAITRAREVVTTPRLLDEKWLRYRPNLFGKYLDLFRSINPPFGGSICDLGCGPGYLLWMCRLLGNCHVQGLEAKDREDLQALWRELKIESAIQIGRISAYQSLQLGRKYDVISATHICFDRIGDEPWNEDAYRYFLEDAARYLTKDGSVYLLFNHAVDPTVAQAMSKLGTWESELAFRMTQRKASDRSSATPTASPTTPV